MISVSLVFPRGIHNIWRKEMVCRLQISVKFPAVRVWVRGSDLLGFQLTLMRKVRNEVSKALHSGCRRLLTAFDEVSSNFESKWNGGNLSKGKAHDHPKTPVIICCDFLRNNMLAGVGDGMPTIDIVTPGRYEAKQLKYVPVESSNLKTVRVDILDIVTKLNMTFSSKLVEKPYIIIKFRPI